MTTREGHNRERNLFSSDDNALTKQIMETHAPDMVDLHVKPVLSIVDDIMRLAKPLTAENSTSGDQIPSQPDTFYDAKVDEVMANPINNISYMMTYKYGGSGTSGEGQQPHSVTIDLLKSLSTFSWDAKLVITLAAFAVNYGEFWLVDHLRTNNHQLADNIATLVDLPDLKGLDDELRKLSDLLTYALKLTHCIVEFMELPAAYIRPEIAEIMSIETHFPTAVYWIIRSLVVCASTQQSVIDTAHGSIITTSVKWEISSLTNMLSTGLEQLQNLLKTCNDLIENNKAYISFGITMRSPSMDNLKVLRAMIKSKEDERPLYDGSKRAKDGLEVLRLKYVLLLISDLELPKEELIVLHLIYSQQSMRHEYEILWLPILDQTTSMNSLQDTMFYDLRNNMPWYSVDHHSLVEPVAIRYVREVWNFVHRPMLVVLDPQGEPSNLDALPMMWIWGDTAFPFTRAREGALWSESSWSIDLLADAIDPRLPEWVSDSKVICLYGGDDIDWIRKFTLSARAAADALHVPLEMLYVGKRNQTEKVRQCHEVIDREKLSHIFSARDYHDYVWYFWVRLWSMWNSKKQTGMTVENDRVMGEIMDLLGYDSGETGWAVFGRGNCEMAKGNGDRVMPVLENYKVWGNKVDRPDKFVRVLDEELRGVNPEHHCNRLILPGQSVYIPDRVVCADCGKTMEKYVMYRCCTD